MKFLLTVLLSATLVACSTPAEEKIINNPGNPPELEQEVEVEIETSLDLGNGVVLNDFSQRQLIANPLILTGVAPRRWYFEGIVPITLMTLEEEVIAEGYGTGPWLELLEGSEELGGEDSIPFTATINYVSPPRSVDMGKLRVAKDLVADEDVPEYVETMILWP